MPSQEVKMTTPLLTAALAGLVLVAAAPSRAADGAQKPDPTVIAKAVHTCAQYVYVLGGAPLSAQEAASVRDIISLLYDGASILFEYPGAPEPALNEKTRRSIAQSYTLKSDFEAKKIKNPSARETDAAVRELFTSDPASWNIHEGPGPERIKRILADAKFSKRLGPEAAKLIERRLKGEPGGRPKILAELAARFGVKETLEDWTSEGCHIEGGFGPD